MLTCRVNERRSEAAGGVALRGGTLPDVNIDVTLIDFDNVVIYHDFDIGVGG